MAESLNQIAAEVVVCGLCPRLVEWRETVAVDPPARYRGQNYWARPVPGFGDLKARLLVIGLAPAAHGGNRTGRIFTGDRSGDFLFRALHRAGFANQAHSVDREDGLELSDCYIAAAVKCAPPANKPLPSERDNCFPYLAREVAALRTLSVVVSLGSFAWDAGLKALAANGRTVPKPKPRFGHAAEYQIDGVSLVGSFHPSQQNTFTGKLTESGFDDVFRIARSLVDS